MIVDDVQVPFKSRFEETTSRDTRIEEIPKNKYLLFGNALPYSSDFFLSLVEVRRKGRKVIGSR